MEEFGRLEHAVRQADLVDPAVEHHVDRAGLEIAIITVP